MHSWAARTIASVIAAVAAAGLAVAHLVVNLGDFPADGSVGLLLGWVIAPAVVALGFSWAAIWIVWSRSAGRLTMIILIVGAVVMWLLFVIGLWSTVTGPGLTVLRPDGPGLWALLGAPSFTVLIVLSRGRPSTKT